MSEHDEQVALFEWAELSTGRFPDLAGLYAVPNGGLRHKAIAAKMKAEGAKAGVPDVCLPVARAGYHGLYIEMKFGRNSTSDAQDDWLRFLEKKHYCVAVCRGFYMARDVIEWYLLQPPTAVVLSGLEEPMPEGISEWKHSSRFWSAE